jgi:hypothetical protein
MPSWVSIPIIPGASYINVSDPDITPTSRVEIAKTTADTRDAKVSKQAEGRCTITFKEPVRQQQYVRYKVRNSAGTA